MATITAGGVKCTTFADCLSKMKAGEDIDYDGPSGSIAFDAQGNPSSGRFTLARVSSGRLTEVVTEDVNLTKNALIDAYEASVASAVLTTTVQQQLTVLGFYSGPIDGVYDDDVKAAVAAFQTSVGLPPTGEFDEATVTALDSRVGTGVGKLSDSTMTLQTELTALGFYTGPIDGRYTQEVVDAVKALQRAVGAPETGVLDVATMQAIFTKGVASVPTTTTPPSTEAPTTTVKPTTTPAPTTPPPTPAPTTPTTPPPTEKATTTTEKATTTTSSTTTTSTTIAPVTVMSVLSKTPQFSDFAGVVTATGMDAELSQDAPMTLFAPTNDALSDADVLRLSGDPQAVLGYLVRGQTLTTGQLTGDLVSASGSTLTIDPVAKTVDGVSITAPNLAAGKGIIQGLGGVLPPS